MSVSRNVPSALQDVIRKLDVSIRTRIFDTLPLGREMWIPTDMKTRQKSETVEILQFVSTQEACYRLRISLWALLEIMTCGQEAAGLNKGSATH